MATVERTRIRQRSGHGKGSVYQDKATGYWVAQIFDDYKPNGKPKYIRVKRKTEKEAVTELNAMIAKKATGKTIVTSDLTLKAWLETWLEDYVKPSSQPRTYDSYAQIVRLWINPTIGRISLRKLKATDVDRLIAKGKRGELSKEKADGDGNKIQPPLSNNSLRLIRATLRRALHVAMMKGKVGENPVLLSEPPKMRASEVIHLETDEVAKILAKADDSTYAALVTLALYTGLRIGELIGLTWDNVDLANSEIRVSRQLQRAKGKFALVDLKTGRRSNRNISIPEEPLKRLKDLSAARMIDTSPETRMSEGRRLNLVFTSSTGNPIHARTVDKYLKELCLSAEVPPVSFHKLRHTVATRMAESGTAFDVIKDQLGHSQIALTVDLYRHAVPAKQREAAQQLANLYGSASKRLSKE